MKIALKLNKIYQYFVLIIAVVCLVFGIIEKNNLLIVLGAFLMVLAIGTIWHILNGKHNSASKLPKDISSK